MLTNGRGQAVDPVPFAVVTGTAFLGCYSFLPVYLSSFGVGAPVALGVTTAVFLPLAAGAYHRLVLNARPETYEEVPAERRLETIVYGALVVVGVLLLLTLARRAL